MEKRVSYEGKDALFKRVFAYDEKGELIEPYKEVDENMLNPLFLAHIGDAYFHLYVRNRLLRFEQSKIDNFHRISAIMVSAVCQAKAYREIENMLTEEERQIYKRGRNAKSHGTKRASAAEYHASTGFEAILGDLFLKNHHERLDEICEAAFLIIGALPQTSAGRCPAPAKGHTPSGLPVTQTDGIEKNT
ncbi:MAG: ribonuclease III [Selenomonadaceae bacterium]|nr:ribonuclease III [Selenomonadaceae bacterium]